MKLALVIALVCAGCCEITWSRAQIGIESTAIAGLACDGGTSEDFLAHGVPETNPVLGAHPSDARLWGYLGGIGVALLVVDHLVLDRYAPHWGPRIATVLAGGVSAVEWESVGHNMAIGSSFCGLGKSGPWEMPVPESRSGT